MISFDGRGTYNHGLELRKAVRGFGVRALLFVNQANIIHRCHDQKRVLRSNVSGPPPALQLYRVSIESERIRKMALARVFL